LTTRSSTLVAPGDNWWHAPGRDERMWVGVVSIWAVAMFVMMLFVWPTIGRQQTTFQSYVVDPAVFGEHTRAFIDAYTVDSVGAVPVVEPPLGVDSYLRAERFQFSPILRLRRGETYRVLISSADVQHGFSLLPDNINLQVVPGYITAIELTPTVAGEYQLVCNEYCGLGHHIMLGQIHVIE
jgi:cytochrome c oxidase subunit II